MLGRFDKQTFTNRLISIDFVRGLAIIGVLFFHPLIYGIWHTEENALNIVHPVLLIIFAPLILIATWGGGFLFISAIVNTYNIYRRMKRGVSFKDATLPVALNSFLLLILSPIRSIFFSRTWPSTYSTDINYSIMSRLIERGELAWPSTEKFFLVGGVLHSIAFGGFLSIIIFYFLFRNNGIDKLKRNSIILMTIGIIWIFIHEPVSHFMDYYVEYFYNRGGGYRLLSGILSMFFGGQLSFFPMGIYTLFGMIGGYMIARKEEFKLIKRFGLGLGCLSLVGFVITTSITVISAIEADIDPFVAIFDYSIYPLELLFFSLGGILLIFPVLIKKFEYTTHEERIRRAEKTVFVRRFGTASLTLYMLEGFFNSILAAIFHKTFGELNNFGEPNAFMTNIPAILLFIASFVTCWFVFVYFWSKAGYKCGFEHLGIILTKPFRKEKTNRLSLFIPQQKKVVDVSNEEG